MDDGRHPGCTICTNAPEDAVDMAPPPVVTHSVLSLAALHGSGMDLAHALAAHLGWRELLSLGRVNKFYQVNLVHQNKTFCLFYQVTKLVPVVYRKSARLMPCGSLNARRFGPTRSLFLPSARTSWPVASTARLSAKQSETARVHGSLQKSSAASNGTGE